MANVFLICNNNYDLNLGDQIISRQLANVLATFGDVQILGTPKEYHEFPQFKRPLARTRLMRALGSLVNRRYYHVFPAGGWGRIDNGRQSVTPTPRQDSIMQRLRDRIELRKIVLGISIDINPDDPVFDDYYLLGVRDADSLASLNQRSSIRSAYFPDLCFFETTDAPLAKQPDRLAISFRSEAPSVGSAFHGEPTERAVRALVSGDIPSDRIVFYHQVDKDQEFVRQLATVASGGSVHPERLHLGTYRSFYERVKYVASNRLHCLLMGAVQGAVPIAMTFRDHRKVVSLFEKVGWESLIVYLDEPDAIPARLREIMAQYDKLRTMVRQVCVEQRDLGFEVLNRHFNG